MKLNDLTGGKFARLRVVSFFGKNKWREILWSCECDCGAQLIATGKSLRSGHTTSCGCYSREQVGIRFKKHGLTNSRTYHSWAGMIQRCTNKNKPRYEEWGGRGITVCQRWLKFENFLEDMGECPDGMSLDRKEVNGNYEPNNCKWSTKDEQANNKRNSRIVHYKGKDLTLAQWVDILSLNYQAVWARLNKGWSVERALETKPRYKLDKSCIKWHT